MWLDIEEVAEDATHDVRDPYRDQHAHPHAHHRGQHVIRHPLREEHLHQMAAPRSNRPRHPQFRPSLRREHHEDHHDQQHPGGDREQTENEEERRHDVASQLEVPDQVALYVVHLERRAFERCVEDRGVQACDDICCQVQPRSHTAFVRDRDEVHLAGLAEQSLERVEAGNKPLFRIEIADAGDDLIFDDRHDGEVVRFTLHEDLDGVSYLRVQRIGGALVHERFVRRKRGYIEEFAALRVDDVREPVQRCRIKPNEVNDRFALPAPGVHDRHVAAQDRQIAVDLGVRVRLDRLAQA